jgi:hypothetical protein
MHRIDPQMLARHLRIRKGHEMKRIALTMHEARPVIGPIPPAKLLQVLRFHEHFLMRFHVRHWR